jgi:hypothetical protein
MLRALTQSIRKGGVEHGGTLGISVTAKLPWLSSRKEKRQGVLMDNGHGIRIGGRRSGTGGCAARIKGVASAVIDVAVWHKSGHEAIE